MKATSCFGSGCVFPLKALLALMFIISAAHDMRAQATATATGQFTDISLGGGEFQYTITLENTGTTNIGTFWNSWVPGKNFMAVSPTDVTPPTGWEEVGGAPTHNGSVDGYAIEFEAATQSALLAEGNSLQFSFDSTATPSEMAGDSTFYPTFPVETSFVYTGAAFSDPGYEFVVQPATVPEPCTLWMLGMGISGLFWTGWHRARGRRALS